MILRSEAVKNVWSWLCNFTVLRVGVVNLRTTNEIVWRVILAGSLVDKDWEKGPFSEQKAVWEWRIRRENEGEALPVSNYMNLGLFCMCCNRHVFCV